MKMIEMMVGSRGMGDAKTMAEMLRRMGRRGDTMLAHITPEEADMLMEAGGSGTINPATGLPEFARRRTDTYFGFEPEGETFRVEQPEIERFQPAPERTVSTDFRQERLNPEVDFTAGLTRRYQQEPRLPEYESVDFGRMPERQTFPTDFQTQRLPQLTNIDVMNRGNVPEFRPLEDIAAPPAEPGLAQRAEKGLQELQDILDRYPNLTRAGTAGASILAQALMFNQANQAMKRDIEATRAAAQPFRQAQSEAMGRATGEGLTAEQQQELEIQQARARQNLGERGTPTGSAAAGILAAQQRRARSLARQESFGEALRLANIADQYDRRALEMELQRDQQLAQLFAGILGREVQQAQRTQAPVQTGTGR
jgi:hypothetical protein